MDLASHENQHELLTVVETATRLRLSVGTINNLLSQGRITRFKLGRRTFIRREEVEALLSGQKKL